MQANDLERFIAAWGTAFEAVGSAKPTAEGMRYAFALLEDLPLDAVLRALVQHGRESVFAPKPADIRRLSQGSAEDRARMAFQAVLDAAATHGVYRSVRFRDPRIHYAIQHMGGWEIVGEWTLEVLPFREKDFQRHFGDAERMSVVFGAPGCPEYLPGYIERTNRAVNAEPEPVCLVGEIEGGMRKALEVAREHRAALPEPVSEDERRENAARVAVLLDGLSGGLRVTPEPFPEEVF